MQNTLKLLLIVAGLINIYPLIGVLSEQQLLKLYAVEFTHQDTLLLMRHRAVLFGILGAFILYSIFREDLRALASMAGLVSMLSFIALAVANEAFGPAIPKIIIADIIGSLALAAVLIVQRQLSRT